MGTEAETQLRTRIGKTAGIVGLVCNLLLCAGKFIAGLLSGSVSITADAANNLSDAASSVISLIGFRLSEKSPDKEHPYGHARYEYISGFVVAVLVMVIGVELLKSGIDRIISPHPVEFTALSAVILLISVAVKLGMALFYLHAGKKIDSGTLTASAADSRNDCISTSAVLAAAVISHFTGMESDGIMAAAVACFILYSGVGLVRETIDPLIGKAPSPELVESIRQKILSYPDVIGTHDLIVHDYGHGRKFATVHVEMPAEKDVIESHSIIDRIERDFLKNDGLNMLVHFDPVAADNSDIHNIRRLLTDSVRLIDSRLSVHDLRLSPDKNGRTRLFFDLAVPPEFSMDEKELCSETERLMHRSRPDISCVITIDRSFAAIPPEKSEE